MKLNKATAGVHTHGVKWEVQAIKGAGTVSTGAEDVSTERCLWPCSTPMGSRLYGWVYFRSLHYTYVTCSPQVHEMFIHCFCILIALLKYNFHTIKFAHLKCKTVFSVFPVLCNYVILEHFITAKRNFYPLTITPRDTSPSPGNCHAGHFIEMDPHGIRAWILSVSMFLRFIRVVPCISTWLHAR